MQSLLMRCELTLNNFGREKKRQKRHEKKGNPEIRKSAAPPLFTHHHLQRGVDEPIKNTHIFTFSFFLSFFSYFHFKTTIYRCNTMYIHLSALLSRVTPESLSNAIFVKRDVRVKTTRTTRRENDDDDDDS